MSFYQRELTPQGCDECQMPLPTIHSGRSVGDVVACTVCHALYVGHYDGDGKAAWVPLAADRDGGQS